MENRTGVFGNIYYVRLQLMKYYNVLMYQKTAKISYQYNLLKHFYMHHQLHLFLILIQFYDTVFSWSSFTISSVVVHLYQENRQSSSYTSFIYRPSLMAMFI